jgi:hypothetical protein
MGELHVGRLYRHEAQLALWRSYVPSEYLAYQEQVGQTDPYDPILILELRQEPRYADRWAHVLAGGMLGWLKVHYLCLEPIDQEGVQ